MINHFWDIKSSKQHHIRYLIQNTGQIKDAREQWCMGDSELNNLNIQEAIAGLKVKQIEQIQTYKN